MQTYHLTMDDGKRLDIQADSAARAIRRALELHLGHIAINCFTGGLAQVKRDAGRMDYIIPPHAPLTQYDLRKYQDGVQTSMFPDAKIKEESGIARGRARYDHEQEELKIKKVSTDAPGESK